MKTSTLEVSDHVALLLAMHAMALAKEIEDMEVGSSLTIHGFLKPLVLSDAETQQKVVADLQSVYHQVIDAALVNILLDDLNDGDTQ